MEAELWKKVEELYHNVLAQPLEQRVEFLKQACPDDPQLRAEVQSLLDQRADSFLESSLLPGIKALNAGAKLGNFEIVELLGRGGMGEVYRARDLRLKREVAVKILSPASVFVANRDRIERFEREARAAAAINHPNICTLYEVGEFNGHPFLVMELLEGATLGQRIGHKPVPIEPMLDWAVQIAEGLDAAHARRIIHRDIKSANLFITTSGQAKILDFGLAKLAGLKADLAAEQTTASRDVLTTLGTVAGTPGYMSPEQVRGEELDARTDLFSLGVVLYEMATGRMPFQGKAPAAIMAAILHDTPEPASDTNPEIPPKLLEIIARAIEKDPAVRYQSAADLRAELKRLKRDMSSRFPDVHISAQPVSATSGAVRDAPRSGSAIVVNVIKRHKWAMTGGIVGFLCFLVAVSWFVLWRRAKPSAELTQERLTFNSSDNPVSSFALSADGKYLAYSDFNGIHVKLLLTGEERLIKKPTDFPANSFWSVACWFPDNAHLLADLTSASPGGPSSMWSVSVLGQTVRKIHDGAMGLEVSPDGAKIAFSPVLPNGAHLTFSMDNVYTPAHANTRFNAEVWVMDSEGSNSHKVVASERQEALRGVHWSPDGRRIALIRSRTSVPSIEICELSGAACKIAVPSELDEWYYDLCWLPDGRIIYTKQEPSGSTGLWKVAIDSHAGTPIGKPSRLTAWPGSYVDVLSASLDGKRLAFLKQVEQGQIEVGQLSARGTRVSVARPLTNDEAYGFPSAWTADSKALLLSYRHNGAMGLFKQNIGEEFAQPVSTGPLNASLARLSPDGAWILYAGVPRTPPNTPARLMRVPVNGGDSETVLEMHDWIDIWCSRGTAGCVVVERSQDRKLLSVTAFDPMKGRGKLLRTTRLTAVQEYTNYNFFAEALSPDGSTFAVTRNGENETHIQLLSLLNGSDREITVKGWVNFVGLDWSVDGKGLYCGSVSPQGRTLLYVDLKGAARILRQYKGIGGGGIWGVPSPDGRSIAILGGNVNSNVWMLGGF
jgi:eukaryotic-like serine/threonine-protein kinase